jgi:hypothetical protein
MTGVTCYHCSTRPKLNWTYVQTHCCSVFGETIMLAGCVVTMCGACRYSCHLL